VTPGGIVINQMGDPWPRRLVPSQRLVLGNIIAGSITLIDFLNRRGCHNRLSHSRLGQVNEARFSCNICEHLNPPIGPLIRFRVSRQASQLRKRIGKLNAVRVDDVGRD
jgi:hypothetical protein